jgi:DNA replication and repair protein RecF
MPLGSFRAERFRCLATIEVDLDPKANLFIGLNASGKTSLLEAAFFLSRGRSFRSRRREALIAHGSDSSSWQRKPWRRRPSFRLAFAQPVLIRSGA